MRRTLAIRCTNRMSEGEAIIEEKGMEESQQEEEEEQFEEMASEGSVEGEEEAQTEEPESVQEVSF